MVFLFYSFLIQIMFFTLKIQYSIFYSIISFIYIYIYIYYIIQYTIYYLLTFLYVIYNSFTDYELQTQSLLLHDLEPKVHILLDGVGNYAGAEFSTPLLQCKC